MREHAFPITALGVKNFELADLHWRSWNPTALLLSSGCIATDSGTRHNLRPPTCLMVRSRRKDLYRSIFPSMCMLDSTNGVLTEAAFASSSGHCILSWVAQPDDWP